MGTPPSLQVFKERPDIALGALVWLAWWCCVTSWTRSSQRSSPIVFGWLWGFLVCCWFWLVWGFFLGKSSISLPILPSPKAAEIPPALSAEGGDRSPSGPGCRGRGSGAPKRRERLRAGARGGRSDGAVRVGTWGVSRRVISRRGAEGNRDVCAGQAPARLRGETPPWGSQGFLRGALTPGVGGVSSGSSLDTQGVWTGRGLGVC